MNTGPLSHSSRSVPQIPHHLTRSCTSPGPGGPGGGTSSTRTSPRPCHRTASISGASLRLRQASNLHHVAQLTRRRAPPPEPLSPAAGQAPPAPACTAPPFLPALPARLTRPAARNEDRQDPFITNITTLKTGSSSARAMHILTLSMNLLWTASPPHQ